MDIKEDKEITMTGSSELSRSYIEDFLGEIVENLEDIELELVNLEMDPGNLDCINSIYCGFHTLKGLAELIKNAPGAKIAAAAEELMDAVRKYNPIMVSSLINLVLDSVNLIKIIFTEPTGIHYIQSSTEVERHLDRLTSAKQDILRKASAMDGDAFDGLTTNCEDIPAPSRLEEALNKQTNIYNNLKFGEVVLREKSADASDIIKAIRMQKVRSGGSNDQYVKIPLDQLDHIIGIIKNVENIYNSVKDEAVIRFGSNDALAIQSEKAFHLINDVSKILKELRMVTLQHAFQKLTRITCSIIEENHLEVKFSTMGENVEVDKELADEIALPLGDLVRLILEKGQSREKESLRIGNIQVVAYDEKNIVHIDISGDVHIDAEELKLSPLYMDAVHKLNLLKCSISIDDIENEGIKISITAQK
ncbi:MAG: hypothetical protein GXX10_00520 [Clostridiaceae bacterium]|nr:hypothetical protein [Clostridiaceae bacterium]